MKRSTGRPGYSHLVCYVKNSMESLVGVTPSDGISHRTSKFAIPDVFYRGEMMWARGIGIDCCYAGVIFLRDIARAKTIIDPFCGQGTVLAMANALGVGAKGVEISNKRCRKAMRLLITDDVLDSVSPLIRNIQLDSVGIRSGQKASGSTEEQVSVKEEATAPASAGSVDSRNDRKDCLDDVEDKR
jgi:hypothetical protein